MTWIISKALLQAYVNSHSLQEQAGESSEENYSVGEQFARSNGNPTRQVYLCSGKTTGSYPLFLSGMTSKHLTAGLGEDLLTWYLEGFLARTLARPAREPGLAVVVRDYGVRWRALSTKYNHDLHLWKTRPSLWEEGWTLSLPTLPRWGSMLDGELWEREMLTRLTSETGSGSLPTPVKYDSHGTWEGNNYHGLGWKAKHEWAELEGAENSDQEPSAPAVGVGKQMWPTPLTPGFRGGSGAPKDLNERLGLAPAGSKSRKIYPTPIKADSSVGKNLLTLQKVENGDGAFNMLAREVRKEEMLSAGTFFSDPSARSGVTEKTAKLWPTPVKNENRAAAYTPETSRRHFLSGEHQVHLAQAARDPVMFPTPTSTNGLRGSSQSDNYPGKWKSPGHPEYGELNPDWVEWIMGWPIGWTSLKPMDPAAFELWFELTSAKVETGQCAWWDRDPSDDVPTSIPKTVKRGNKVAEEARVSRIAACGNGQVSAACAAAAVFLYNMPFPQSKE